MLRRLGNIRLLHAAGCAGALSIPASLPSESVAVGGLTAAVPPVPLISHLLVGAGSRKSEPIVAEQPPEGGPGTAHNGIAEDEDLIVFDPPVLDFGRVVAGSVVSKEVWVINRSDSPVTVVETNPTCGCTVARVAGQTINPGSAVSTVVRFTAPRRGEVTRKQVRFRFEGITPDQLLAVVAEVVLPVVLEPRVVEVEELGRAEITIESGNGQSFRVHGAKPSVLAMPFDGQSAPARVHHLKIDPLLWHATGMPSQVEIAFDHPEVASLVVRIHGGRPAVISRHDPRRRSAQQLAALSPRTSLRLSTNRLQFGEVKTDLAKRQALTIFGEIPPDTDPDLHFESVHAELLVADLIRGPESIELTLQLVPKPNQRGYVRGPLTVRLGEQSATCQVFAKVNSIEPLSPTFSRR